MLGYLLLALVPAAAVAYIVWAHRKRTAERAAVSSRRFAEMFGTPSATKPAAAAVPAAESAPAALCTRRETLLDARRFALFRSLSVALSGYQVCPHVTLTALVELPATLQGRDREQRLRALGQNAIDFVICDTDVRPLAAVDLEAGASAESLIKSEYLAAAGIRYLRLQPDVSIEPAEIRRRILGPLPGSAA